VHVDVAVCERLGKPVVELPVERADGQVAQPQFARQRRFGRGRKAALLAALVIRGGRHPEVDERHGDASLARRCCQHRQRIAARRAAPPEEPPLLLHHQVDVEPGRRRFGCGGCACGRR